jgi:hypothetical protein
MEDARFGDGGEENELMEGMSPVDRLSFPLLVSLPVFKPDMNKASAGERPEA